MAAIERGVRQTFYPARHAGARLERNPVFARLDAFDVDAQLASNLNAIFGGAAGLARHPRACHQRLSRNAAGVDTRTAYMLALDDRGPESLLRETVCERRAGLARTNNNRVEFPGHGHRFNHKGIRVQRLVQYGAGPSTQGSS